MSKSDPHSRSNYTLEKNVSETLDLQKQVSHFDVKCRPHRDSERDRLKDLWSVQRVPCSFESVSRPSYVVDNLLAIRKVEHETAVKNLKNELDSLRKLCEVKINDLESELQAKIEFYNDDVDGKKNYICETLNLKNEDYDKIKSEVEMIIKEERKAIDDTFELIKSVESSSQSEAVEVFKRHNRILRKLFYLQPCELKKYMEKQIMEYNQESLENYSKYEERKLKFRVKTDVLRKDFCVWLKEIMKDKSAVCRKNALNEFYNEYDNFMSAGMQYLKTIEGKAALCRLKSRKSILSETLAQWDTTVPYPEKKIEDEAKQLETVLTSTDAMIAGFIESYKSYMSRYLGRLQKKLNKLLEVAGVKEQPDEEVNSALETYEKAKGEIENFVLELESIWSSTLLAFNEKAEETLKPFRQLGSPWEKLDASLAKLQEQIMEQLKNKTIKSRSLQGDLDDKIYSETEALRQEDSVEGLEKKLKQVLALVDKKAQKYQADFNDDSKIIKKCKESIEKELKAMQATLDKFLMSTESAETLASRETSYHSFKADSLADMSLEEIILFELNQVGKQIDCFDLWKSKLLKNMSLSSSSFEEGFLDGVDKWVNELIEESEEYVKNNLLEVEKLRESIQNDVYDYRMNELLAHKQQLEQHKKTIGNVIEESAKCALDFLDLTDVFDEYNVKSSKLIEEYGPNANHSSQIICLQNMLKSLKEKFLSEVESRLQIYADRSSKKTNLLNETNDAFLNDIILFEDGGTYGKAEWKSAKTEAGSLAKSISKDEHENRVKVKKAQDQFSKRIDGIEKSNLDSLNVTMQKLKLTEDICNALIKSKHLIEVKMKELMDLNTRVPEEIANFVEKCRNQIPLEDLLESLNQLIELVIKCFEFIRGPFMTIDIPKHLTPVVETQRNGKQKKGKAQKNDTTTSAAKCNIDNKSAFDTNFASVTGRSIQDTLNIIKDRGNNFYTSLMQKKELIFPDKNKTCEECINDALQRLAVFYVTANDFWTKEAEELLHFLSTIEMPSIDWYLLPKEESDKEEEEQEVKSTISKCTRKMDSKVEINPNIYTNAKLEEKFSKFKDFLEEMQNLLRSKSTEYEDGEEIENKSFMSCKRN